MQEEIISNRLEQVLGEWICLHDEEDHFPGMDNSLPCIKLCSRTLRIRANDAWSKLPLLDKEVMVAHEMGHREYQHYLQSFFFDRFLSVINGEIVKQELDADLYAVKKCGLTKVITVLENAKNRAGHFSSKEFDLRIKALKTYYVD